MTRTIDTTLITEKNKTTSTASWIWLFETQIDADDALRAAKYTTDVSWPTAAPDVFDAYPIAFDFIGESGDGRQRTTTVSIPNADKQLLEKIRANTGLVDKRVIIRLTHSSQLDKTSIPEWLFDIADSTVTRDVITWTLGLMNIFSLKVPFNQYLRGSCRFQFGTPDSPCPYQKDAPGTAFTTCEKTWEACEARGLDQVRLGMQRTLPRMFGGFRSIPRPRN